MNHIEGATCDQYANTMYWFNSRTNNESDSTMFRGNMDEDDDPFDQMKHVY